MSAVAAEPAANDLRGEGVPASPCSVGHDATQFVTRAQLLAGILIVPLVNGLAARSLQTISDNGWLHALNSALGTSAIVWLAVYAALRLIKPEGEEQPRRIDWAVAVTVVALAALPVVHFSWLALTISSSYILGAYTQSALRRASSISLAITAPMLWGPLLMQLYFEPFRIVDTALVSALMQTERVGSVVPLQDGAPFRYLMIAPGSQERPGDHL